MSYLLAILLHTDRTTRMISKNIDVEFENYSNGTNRRKFDSRNSCSYFPHLFKQSSCSSKVLIVV